MPTIVRSRKSSSRRRREILDAALRCFLQQGFHATTIEQIRDTSGVSHGSIYHHFGSKAAIALALYEEGMHDYRETVLSRLTRQATAEQGIRAIVEAHLEWTANDPARSLYLTRVASADVAGETAARIDAVNREFFHAVGGWLAPFAERGTIMAAVPELSVALILGPAAHLCRHWLAGRVTGDLLSFSNELANAAWQAMRTPT